MQNAAGTIIETTTQPVTGTARGACPALATPMLTGDGLLVRLRPAGGALTIAQFQQLAKAAAARGTGILEITARGNLQIRGLRSETVPSLAADIQAAGIGVPDGVTIEISPLHGLDPDEIADATEMEAGLREKLGGALSSPHLAPKLSILIDGGGRFSLSKLVADIRLVAQKAGQWLLSIAGDEGTARPLLQGDTGTVIAATHTLLQILIARGRQTRARDLEAAMLREHFPEMDSSQSTRAASGKTTFTGMTRLADGKTVLGVRLKFGQSKAADLHSLLDDIAHEGATEIRLTPDRGFLLIGLAEGAVPAIERAGLARGFSMMANDPSEQVAACAGAGACASAFYDTRALAGRLTERVSTLFDGSIMLHLSGCAKGCAHRRADLAIVGSPAGYDFILDGLAADRPTARIAGGQIDFAIERLARLIEDKRGAGESSADCLKRLGRDRLAEALQQE